MLFKAAKVNWISGFLGESRDIMRLNISHLRYADDKAFLQCQGALNNS